MIILKQLKNKLWAYGQQQMSAMASFAVVTNVCSKIPAR
jgi:hypothetical protein